MFFQGLSAAICMRQNTVRMNEKMAKIFQTAIFFLPAKSLLFGFQMSFKHKPKQTQSHLRRNASFQRKAQNAHFLSMQFFAQKCEMKISEMRAGKNR